MIAPIGLAGPGGVGKTTTARAICALDDRYRLVPIGAHLKAMIRALFREAGIDDDHIDRLVDGDLKREPLRILQDRSPTHAMQTLGTEWGRSAIGDRLWLDLWIQRATRLQEEGFAAIQDSVRFPNEVDAIRSLGGIVVRLVGVTTMTGQEAGHASERPVPADLEIIVDAPPEEIARRVLAAVSAGAAA